MNDDAVIELNTSYIKGIDDLNSKYKPISKDDYLKIYLTLKVLDILVNAFALIGFGIIGFTLLLLFMKFVIYIFSFTVFSVDFEMIFHGIGWGVASIVFAKLLYNVSERKLKENNLSSFLPVESFSEINLDQYNAVKNLCDLNEVYKCNIQRILNFREGKIFNFDYDQLNSSGLNSAYKIINSFKDSSSKLEDCKKKLLSEITK